MTQAETAYRSETLMVRVLDPKLSDDAVLITFDSLQPRTGPPRAHGFGEAAFERRGLSAIHVLDLKNRWYQTPDIETALECVRRLAARFQHRTTYGASMGGYAALRYAAALDADRAIAMAPQWSIDPQAPPFEARWADDFHSHPAFHEDMDERLRGAKGAVVAYDPYHPDARHIDQYRRARPDFDYLALAFTGHFPAGPLLDIGILPDTVASMARSAQLDFPGLRRRFRQERRASASYWFALADAASRHGHHVLSLHAIKQADALQPSVDRIAQQANILVALGEPDDAIAFLSRRARGAASLRDALMITSTLFHHLHQAGRYEEAGDALRTILAMFPATTGADMRDPVRIEEQRLLGRLYANVQDWPAAIGILRLVLRATPNDLEVLRTASGAFMMLGYLPTAITLARRACSLAPFNADYQLHLGHLLQRVDEVEAAEHMNRAVALAGG